MSDSKDPDTHIKMTIFRMGYKSGRLLLGPLFYWFVQVTCRAARPSHWLALDHVLHGLLARECITCSLEGLSLGLPRERVLYQQPFLCLIATRSNRQSDTASDMGSLSYLPLCGDIGVCQRNNYDIFIPTFPRGWGS